MQTDNYRKNNAEEDGQSACAWPMFLETMANVCGSLSLFGKSVNNMAGDVCEAGCDLVSNAIKCGTHSLKVTRNTSRSGVLDRIISDPLQSSKFAENALVRKVLLDISDRKDRKLPCKYWIKSFYAACELIGVATHYFGALGLLDKVVGSVCCYLKWISVALVGAEIAMNVDRLKNDSGKWDAKSILEACGGVLYPIITQGLCMLLSQFVFSCFGAAVCSGFPLVVGISLVAGLATGISFFRFKIREHKEGVFEILGFFEVLFPMLDKFKIFHSIPYLRATPIPFFGRQKADVFGPKTPYGATAARTGSVFLGVSAIILLFSSLCGGAEKYQKIEQENRTPRSMSFA
jgi:hypothetical protein